MGFLSSIVNLFKGSAPFTYTVKSGDTLSSIAERVYGRSSAWPIIYTANQTVIGKNPDRILPGQKLHIPAE